MRNLGTDYSHEGGEVGGGGSIEEEKNEKQVGRTLFSLFNPNRRKENEMTERNLLFFGAPI